MYSQEMTQSEVSIEHVKMMGVAISGPNKHVVFLDDYSIF